ncbi:MAG: class I SAM-dependent methyltransferase [Myxococcota bacterium]
MDVFYEIHHNLPREGPGRDEDTLRALSMIAPHLPKTPRILDIGCGPGMQTIALAKHTDGFVVALDRHPPFLEQLNIRAAQAGVSDRIRTVEGTMTALPFDLGSFDLIWAEGAIYIIGFESGLHRWRSLLKPEGCMAVSELTWHVDDPAPEAKHFWSEAYPAMRNNEDNRRMIVEAGYRELGHFHLPPEAWWTYYYTPIEERIEALRCRYGNDAIALQTLDEECAEIALYRNHHAHYGYTFYTMQRCDDAA